jgi:plasmid stabilization system protein ParE
MSGCVLGSDAEQDLDEIWEYIAEDSVHAADPLLAELFEAFEELVRTPRIGHKREDLSQFPLLFWPVGNYLVIYRAERSPVEVVAIAHGKRDIPELLRRRSAGQQG